MHFAHSLIFKIPQMAFRPTWFSLFQVFSRLELFQLAADLMLDLNSSVLVLLDKHLLLLQQGPMLLALLLHPLELLPFRSRQEVPFHVVIEHVDFFCMIVNYTITEFELRVIGLAAAFNRSQQITIAIIFLLIHLLLHRILSFGK